MSTQEFAPISASPRILHLSTYDVHGGAARAAYAIHKALLESGVQSRMRVAQSAHSDPTITSNREYPFKLAKELDRRLWSLQDSQTDTWRSPARFGSITAREINASSADIVHLHWVTDGFMTVETIGAIRKPIVWSLCDAWAFSGAEHYATVQTEIRAQQGYSAANRPPVDSGVDIDRWTWSRKKKLWKKPMHLVPASTWLTTATEQSALMGGWPTTRIPHIVNTDIFSPRDQGKARTLFGIPSDRAVLLFLASGGINDRRKGWDLLAKALLELDSSSPLTIVNVGPQPTQSEKESISSQSGHRFIFFGEAHGDDQLADLYSSADVTVVPSREDNMPITAMESQSCGTPVVAFDIGGLPDIVTHKQNGYLAQAENFHDLAAGISWVLDINMREAARHHALHTWSPAAVVPQLTAIYRVLSVP